MVTIHFQYLNWLLSKVTLLSYTIHLSAETATFSSRFTENEEVLWRPFDNGSWYDVFATVPS